MESSRSRPYLCKLCGRKVHTISALQQHTRIHRSKFPYQCNYCSKSFRLLSQLKCHQVLHDDERPIKCGWCDEHFLEQYQLGQHLLRKHKIIARSIGTRLVVANPKSLTVQTYNMATGKHTLVIKKTARVKVDDDNKIATEVIPTEVNHEDETSEDNLPITQEIHVSNMEPERSVESVMVNGEGSENALSEIKPAPARTNQPMVSPLDSDKTLNDNAAQSGVKSTKRTLTLEEHFSVESSLDDVDGTSLGERKEVNEIESFIDMNGNAMMDLGATHDTAIEIESDTDSIINLESEAGVDVIAPIGVVKGKANAPVQGDDAEVNEAIMLLTGLQDVTGESSAIAAGGETLGEEPGFQLAMMTDDDSRSLTNTSDPTQNVLRGDPSLHACPSRDDLFSFDETVAFTEDVEMLERAKPSSSELSMVPAWSSGNLAGLMLSGTPQKLSVDPGAASVNASPAMSPFRATIGQGGSDSEDSDTEMERLPNVEALVSIAESGNEAAGPVTADKESSISPGHTEASNGLPIKPNAINFIKTDISPFPNLKSFSGQEQLQRSTLNELKSLTDNVREETLYKGFISLPKSMPTNMKLVNGVFCLTDSTPLPTPLVTSRIAKITVNTEIKRVNRKKTDSTPRPTSPIIPVNPAKPEESEINHDNEMQTDLTPQPTSPGIPVNPEITDKSEIENLNEMITGSAPRPTSPIVAVISEAKHNDIKVETSPISPGIPEITENIETKHLNEMKKEKEKVVKIVVQEEPQSRRLRAKSDPLPHKRKRKRAPLDEDFLYDFVESPLKKTKEQGSKPMRQFSDIFQDFVSNEKPDENPYESPAPSPPPPKRRSGGRRRASVLDTSASETDAQTVPKRRGRPPKSVMAVENGGVIPEVQKSEKESLPKQTPVPNVIDNTRRPHRANAGKRRHSVKWDDSFAESDTTEVSESDSSSKPIGSKDSNSGDNAPGSKDSNSGDNAPDYNLRPKRRKNFQFLQDDADCECCTNGDKKRHKTLNIPHYVEHADKVREMRILITRLIRTVFPDLNYPNLFYEGGLAVEYLMDEIMGACTDQDTKRKLGTPFGKVNDRVQVVLCKYPMGCLRHLRRKAVRLLDSLLPGIQSEGLEPSEINSLIEQVIETNQNAIAVDQPGDEF